MDASGAFGVADEAEVGIFTFASSDFEPLGGIIKTVPEDFLVWEIRLDGTVVLPPRRSASFSPKRAGAGGAAAEVSKAWPEPGVEGAVAELTAWPEQELEAPRGGRRWTKEGGDPAGASLESEANGHTEDEEEEAHEVEAGAGEGQVAKPSGTGQGKLGSLEDAPYLKFALWKRSTDTLEALGSLANGMGVPVGQFGFAGIKDSVAVTCQEITVPRRLPGFCSIPRIVASDCGGAPVDSGLVTPALLRKAAEEAGEHIRVGAFSGCSDGLYPGQLQGNRFRIRVRRAYLQGSRDLAFVESGDAGSLNGCQNAECQETPGRRRKFGCESCREGSLISSSAVHRAVQKGIRAVRRSGFVNYVGMQRFGKGGVRSDLVGLAYLQRDYERCVDLILFGPPEGGSHGSGSSAVGKRAKWRPKVPKWAEVFRQTWSADAALQHMPDRGRGHYWVERRVLQSLKRSQEQAVSSSAQRVARESWYEQCRRAFITIPWSMRKLYTFAYLDRLWNLVVSERVAAGASAPIVGDLVWEDREAKTVRVLQKEDLTTYTIFDVLIPRLGVSVQLPDNVVGNLMKQYLSYDLDDGIAGLAIEVSVAEAEDANAEAEADGAGADTEPENTNKEWNDENKQDNGRSGADGGPGGMWVIHGDYRTLLCRPQRLRWSVRQEREQNRAGHAGDSSGLHEVTLVFDLPRGTYATMFLRELMRRRGQHRCSPDGRSTAVGGKGEDAVGAVAGALRHQIWSSSDEDVDES